MSTLRCEIKVYLAHCAAVFRPGHTPPLFGQPQAFDARLSSWSEVDLTLVIEEGRRQLDRQLSDLERIRTRSAVLVTVGIAEIGLLTTGMKQIFEACSYAFALWVISALLIVLGLLGAAGVLTATANFGRIDTRLVALLPPPVRPMLAEGYADTTGIGEHTVATRLTVFRTAVMLVISAAVIYSVAWGLSL